MPHTKKQLPQSSLFWVLALAMPLTTMLSTHLWLRTAYSGGVFHLQGFLELYGGGVYRYRLLGRYAVLFVYHHLLLVFHDHPFVMPRDPNATILFYFSYVIVNAICFAASNFLLLLILSDQQRRLSDLNLATYLYLALMQTFAMAVVTPYDQLSYLFILISLFAVTIRSSWIRLLPPGYCGDHGHSDSRDSTACHLNFVCPSCLLQPQAVRSVSGRPKRVQSCPLRTGIRRTPRVLIKGPKVVSGVWTFGGTWAPEALIVLALLFFVSTTLALRMYADLRPTIALLVFSVPYIVTILASGVLRELRLLVPMLLAQTFVYVQLARDSSKAAEYDCGGLRNGLNRLAPQESRMPKLEE